MIIRFEISDEKTAKFAVERYPELVTRQYCCNGKDCGCGGGYEQDTSKAIETFIDDLDGDENEVMEILNDYPGDFKVEVEE
jgi:hypothetical protein